MTSIGTLNIDFQTNVATLINDMRRASAAVEQSSNQMNRSLQNASRSITAFVAGFLTLRTVKGIVSISDQFTSLEARVRASTRTAEEFRQAFDEIKKSSQQTGAGLEQTVAVLQRISFIRDELKASVAEMTRFTDTVSKLGVASGAGPEALTAGLLQLSQGLSSAVLRAEEFNSIMENIPAVGKAIADEFGVTTGQLRNLVLQGEVLSQDVFAAILNQSQEANKQFEQMPQTIGRATSALSQQFDDLVTNVLKASGAQEGMVTVLNRVTEIVKGINEDFKSLTATVKVTFLQMEDDISRIFDNITQIAATQASAIAGLFGQSLQTSQLIGRGTGPNNELLIKSILATQRDRDQMDSALDRLKERVKATGIKEVFETKEISKNYAEIAKSVGEGTKKRSAAAKEAEKHANAIKSVIENLKFENEQLGRNAQQQELYASLRQAGVTIDSQAGQAIAALVGEHQRLEEVQKRGAALQEELVKRGQQAIEQHKKAFEGFNNVVEQGLRGQIKSWKDLGQAILAEVQNIIVAQYQMQAGNGSSGIGGVLNSIFGLFGPKLSQGAIDLAVGGQLFARGGISSRPAIFGEAGPEAAVPLPDGRRIPVDLRGAASGGTYIIDARGADRQGLAQLEQTIKTLNGSIERRALSAVRNENSRNPKFLR